MLGAQDANVLNKLPKSIQPKARRWFHDIWQAETCEAATRAFDAFVEDFEARYPAGVACLVKDRAAQLMFYDFPTEHWQHIRTTNAIESIFATVRLRTAKTKGSGSRAGILTVTRLHLVNTIHNKYGDAESDEVFCERHPELMQKTSLRLFSSIDRMMSPEAKTTFLSPDLAPLPDARKQ